MFINNETTHDAHASRMTRVIVQQLDIIMTKRNQRANARNNESNVTNDDAHVHIEMNVNDDASHDIVHDVINAQIDAQIDDANDNATSTNVVTLKHIIAMHKIKCDAKLIRRVLRKYYASKINHQLRDAWTFHESQIDDVVKLIDTHCRSMKSSTNA
jgi:hypothetical protein